MDPAVKPREDEENESTPTDAIVEHKATGAVQDEKKDCRGRESGAPSLSRRTHLDRTSRRLYS
jgi:hypothetical protein